MRVFISWSGDRSRHVAAALRDWLPIVVQSAEPWMSDHDIGAGQRWAVQIGAELAASDFGIVVVTPENLTKPWLHFEAGALAKAIEHARVVPYLYSLRKSDLTLPLSMFQAAEADVGGTLKLVAAINDASKERRLSGHQVEHAFHPHWPELERRIKSTPPATDGPATAKRPVEQILEEVLELVRDGQRTLTDAQLDSVARHIRPHGVRLVRKTLATSKADWRSSLRVGDRAFLGRNCGAWSADAPTEVEILGFYDGRDAVFPSREGYVELRTAAGGQKIVEVRYLHASADEAAAEFGTPPKLELVQRLPAK